MNGRRLIIVTYGPQSRKLQQDLLRGGDRSTMVIAASQSDSVDRIRGQEFSEVFVSVSCSDLSMGQLDCVDRTLVEARVRLRIEPRLWLDL